MLATPTVADLKSALLIRTIGQACLVHLDQLQLIVLVVCQQHSVTKAVLVNVWSTTPERIVVNIVDRATMLVQIAQVQALSTVSYHPCVWSMRPMSFPTKRGAANVTPIILPRIAPSTEVTAIQNAISATDHPPTSANNA